MEASIRPIFHNTVALSTVGLVDTLPTGYQVVEANTMTLYKARWGFAGQTDIGSVDFKAQSDFHAKQTANKTARELGLTNTPRTLMREYKVIECLSKGVSDD